ncbi:MAG: cellulase family glycosylhydrolase [Saprospiraceae bacterium]|nr:cellulase family glycosylhydrolase [Saprospiraceae bacterium]
MIPSLHSRRRFLKDSSFATAAMVASPSRLLGHTSVVNKLPYWKGFNLLDFFSPDPSRARDSTKEEYFKWMADWGFNFVRIPMAYPAYIRFDRTKDLTTGRVRKFDRKAVEKVDNLIYLAQKYGLHASLNLHRAPGFCVNAGFKEPYNLWTDDEALDDFCHHWKFWAKRYKSSTREEISFDLLNEPCVREDMNDQHSKRGPIPGELYRNMVLRAMKVIRKANPNHLIIADGNNVGRDVISEITDLDVGQSCRGYNPGIISHYRAPWVYKDSSDLPVPIWPGQVGDQYLDRSMLEEFYQPWIDLVNQGVGVHCGECGCWNKTPHSVFLAWFSDLLDILRESKIGFALWEFRGSFGILDSGREDVAYEDWHGHKLDRKLLNLLQEFT